MPCLSIPQDSVRPAFIAGCGPPRSSTRFVRVGDRDHDRHPHLSPVHCRPAFRHQPVSGLGGRNRGVRLLHDAGPLPRLLRQLRPVLRRMLGDRRWLRHDRLCCSRLCGSRMCGSRVHRTDLRRSGLCRPDRLQHANAGDLCRPSVRLLRRLRCRLQRRVVPQAEVAFPSVRGLRPLRLRRLLRTIAVRGLLYWIRRLDDRSVLTAVLHGR